LGSGRNRKPYNYNISKKGIARCPYCKTKRYLVVHSSKNYPVLKDKICREDGTIEYIWDRNLRSFSIYCNSFQYAHNKPGDKGCTRNITRYARSLKKARELCVQDWNDPYGDI